MAQARGFFERALVLDPQNVEALVGMANVDADSAGGFRTDDRGARLAVAEMTVLKALSMAPQHAMAHMQLGFIQIQTNRTAQGIAECERALALDPNLAGAHAWVGLAKICMSRGEETEAHIIEALRLSPRDTGAFRWMGIVGVAKLHLSADAEAVPWLRQSIEANRSASLVHFWLAASLALLGQVDQARPAAQAGLALDPDFTIRRYRAGAPSDNPTFLAKRERIYEGMRMAGVPEG
jgi:tetratricopeptide (TPR) repeat protein